MFDDDDTPSPHHLADDPELAILAALNHVLCLAGNALLAAHPLLAAPREDLHDDNAAWVAEVLLAQARALNDTIAVYRHALQVAQVRRCGRIAANDF